MSDHDDLMAMSSDIAKLAESGSFNPFSLIAGENRFHSLFLAPFSPALSQSIARFLADGTGPLEDVVRIFQGKGAAPADALQQARQMFSAARAMLVAVMAGDHGPSTIPQLFFGQLDDTFAAHALQACGDGFPAGPAFTAALVDLRKRQSAGAAWPALIAGPGAGTGVAAYWDEIGRMLVGGLDGGVMPGNSIERLRDLAHWAAAARLAAPGVLGAASAQQVVRLQLIAGEVLAAATRLDALLSPDADADALVELAVHIADAALANLDPVPTARWLTSFTMRLEALFGISYELRLAVFRLLAGAASPTPVMLEAAARLVAANRKSARQDLAREPIWRVVIPEPGVLLDTTAAAALVGRSTTFLAKRLENRTIPVHRQATAQQGEQVRIPEQALVAWKAVMDEHKLLD
jgi:hypothetical protein